MRRVREGGGGKLAAETELYAFLDPDVHLCPAPVGAQRLARRQRLCRDGNIAIAAAATHPERYRV